MKKQTKLGLVLAAAALISVSVASLVQAKGWVQEGAEWRYVDNGGEYVTDTIQASGNAKFYLNEDGYMAKDFFLEDYDNAYYYFGANGAMVTNTWVAIESGNVSETIGDYTPDNFWYYFQASGKAVKGTNDKAKKMTIDGKKYMFNQYGQMCSGWVKENGEVIDPDTDEEGGPFKDALYYAGGDNDGALRAGWVTYYDGYNDASDGQSWYDEKTTLYFYFNTSNNKKEFKDNEKVTKKINGKTYMFDSTGIMLSGWDYVDMATSFDKKDAVYFSGEDDGHQVKKGWVYAVPAANINASDYDDGEERYFYFGSSGSVTRDTIKKINGKYYAFANDGIMKTGLVIWNPTGADGLHYVNKFDMDYAEGSEVTKHGKLTTGDGEYIKVQPDGKVIEQVGNDNKITVNTDYIKLHFFGDDGARKTGTNTVNFSDDAYTFVSTSTGNKASGKLSKKYYALGIQLKANGDIRYGLFQTATANQFSAQQGVYDGYTYSSDPDAMKYEVITTSGSQQKGANSAKKDADGNYWLIDSGSNYIKGIYTVNVKYAGATITASGKMKTADIPSSNIVEGLTVGNTIESVLSEISSFDDATKKALNKYLFNEDSLVPGLYDATIQDAHIAVATNSDIPVTVEGVEYTPVTIRFFGYQFQSDKGDKSNVWLPFGVKDGAQKTARLHYEDGNTDSYYQVALNDDYFVNCYWKD